jgi:hypothetical protein
VPSLPATFSFVALLAITQSACDPCFGTVTGCVSDPRLSLQGRIVDNPTASSVEGAQVSVVITDGGVIARDSTTRETDRHGYFEVSFHAASADTITYDVLVESPDGTSYRVRDLRTVASVRRGEGHDLGLWVARPYFDAIAEFSGRCQPGSRFRNTEISFVRTGGVIVTGLSSTGSLTQRTDSNGQMNLFGSDIRPAGLEPLLGVFKTVINGVALESGAAITPHYLYRDARPIVPAQLGPAESFIGCIYDRGSVQPVRGISVEFTRTGGVPTGASVVSAQTDSLGAFSLALQPATVGPVIGDLTIHSPSPSSTYVKRGVVLDHVADPLAKPSPRFGVGLHLPYYGFVKRGSDPVKNVQIIIKRVGGSTVTRDSVSTLSDGYGMFLLYPLLKPTSAGDVIADVTVIPPAPDKAFVLRAVRIPTVDEDSDARVLFDLDLTKSNGEPLAAAGTRSRP